jgi:hypothetical protein
MKDPSQVRVTGPLGPYAKGFRAELAGQGYASSSAVNQLKLVGHLSRWMTIEGLSAPELLPVEIGRYVAARRAARYRHNLSELLRTNASFLADSAHLQVKGRLTATSPFLARDDKQQRGGGRWVVWGRKSAYGSHVSGPQALCGLARRARDRSPPSGERSIEAVTCGNAREFG